jgi:hypothetical protein
MKSPIALGQFQITTPQALVANGHFNLVWSIAGTSKLEIKF